MSETAEQALAKARQQLADVEKAIADGDDSENTSRRLHELQTQVATLSAEPGQRVRHG